MNEELKESYKTILSTLDATAFNQDEDRYSGVFLPVAFDEYLNAPDDAKVMLVGQQTEKWNTDNKKNRIGRFKEFPLDQILDEAIARYKQDEFTPWLGGKKGGLQGYHNRLAKNIGLDPKGVVWANLFAWDYNNGSPLGRPEIEFDEICRISKELLAAQIQAFKPEHIVFATGRFIEHDPIIKDMFERHLNGYDRSQEPKRGLWTFSGAGATCFRINHPASQASEHAAIRTDVINRIKKFIDRS